MSKFTLNTKEITKAIKWAMLDSVQLLEERILEITPRDPKRLPQNINRKDWKKPKRRWWVASVGGNYYPQVTGNLKRSIAYQEIGAFVFKIGIKQWEGEYWEMLEFWTKFMAPRSFLRKWIIDNRADILKNFAKVFNKLTK